jgi:hypothetical protein
LGFEQDGLQVEQNVATRLIDDFAIISTDAGMVIQQSLRFHGGNCEGQLNSAQGRTANESMNDLD